MQQERALAGAGISADENDGTRHETASEYPIKFLHAGGQTYQRCGLNFGEPCDLRWRAAIAWHAGAGPGSGPFQRELTQRVPFPAGGALALPFRMFDAAVVADVRDFSLGHREP